MAHILSKEPLTLTSTHRYCYHQSILHVQLGPVYLYFVYATSINYFFTTFMYMIINYGQRYVKHILLHHGQMHNIYSYMFCIYIPILPCTSPIVILNEKPHFSIHNNIYVHNVCLQKSMYKSHCQLYPLKRPYPAGYIQLHSEPGN